MRSNADVFVALMMLTAYSYAQLYAHVLLARADKKSSIPRRLNGEIRLREIKAFVSTRASVIEPETRKALTMLKMSNYIVYLFFAWLIYSIVSR